LDLVEPSGNDRGLATEPVQDLPLGDHLGFELVKPLKSRLELLLRLAATGLRREPGEGKHEQGRDQGRYQTDRAWTSHPRQKALMPTEHGPSLSSLDKPAPDWGGLQSFPAISALLIGPLSTDPWNTRYEGVELLGSPKDFKRARDPRLVAP
jgi:hypothetical protein